MKEPWSLARVRMRQKANNRRPASEAGKVAMRTMAPPIGIAVLMTCALSSVFAQSPSEDDARAGRTLALNICTPCHIVSSDQQFAPIFTGPPKPPDFHAIANKPGSTAESLRKFLSTTHSTETMPLHMPSPSLTDDQMRKIVAFVLGLREQR